MSEACRSGPKHYGRVSDFRETKMENEATPEVERAIESTVEHKKSAIPSDLPLQCAYHHQQLPVRLTESIHMNLLDGTLNWTK